MDNANLMRGKIEPIGGLKQMAASIAASYGDKGAIVLTWSDEGVRVGVSGLSHEETEKALCVAIHYNFCFSDAESTS